MTARARRHLLSPGGPGTGSGNSWKMHFQTKDDWFVMDAPYYPLYATHHKGGTPTRARHMKEIVDSPALTPASSQHADPPRRRVHTARPTITPLVGQFPRPDPRSERLSWKGSRSSDEAGASRALALCTARSPRLVRLEHGRSNAMSAVPSSTPILAGTPGCARGSGAPDWCPHPDTKGTRCTRPATLRSAARATSPARSSSTSRTAGP
jgi:hypothetical protein